MELYSLFWQYQINNDRYTKIMNQAVAFKAMVKDWLCTSCQNNFKSTGSLRAENLWCKHWTTELGINSKGYSYRG